MKQVSLSGSLRENVGRRGASDLRTSERVPGVLYGGKEQVHLSLGYVDLQKVLNQPDTLRINLEVEGKTYPSIVQEVQYHPVTDRILHIDFLELVDGKEIKTALPLRTTGSAIGVKGWLSITANCESKDYLLRCPKQLRLM
jgi:large subunit ribosomal protein L25